MFRLGWKYKDKAYSNDDFIYIVSYLNRQFCFNIKTKLWLFNFSMLIISFLISREQLFSLLFLRRDLNKLKYFCKEFWDY